MQPRARKDLLIVQELDGETLVYDRRTDKAHCLNASAAFVWKNCNGRKSVRQIASALGKEFGAPVSDDVVNLALEHLDRSKLLEERLTRAEGGKMISRRDVARRLGLAAGAALALPTVLSIVAPRVAEAASCLQPGVPGFICCTSPGDCVGNPNGSHCNQCGHPGAPPACCCFNNLPSSKVCGP